MLYTHQNEFRIKKIFFVNKLLHICNLSKMEGILNKAITNFCDEKTSDDIKKIVGVCGQIYKLPQLDDEIWWVLSIYYNKYGQKQ